MTISGSRMFAPLAYRNYRLLLGGQMASVLGDTFFAVAVPWLMLTSGGGVQALSILLASFGVPRVATTLLGGALSDQLSPRRVMLLADTGRAVLMSVLVALVLAHMVVLWQFCILGAALGALGGVFMPASAAMLPEVLPDDALQSGNALNAVAMPLISLVGPGLAGLIVGHLQAGVPLMVDALSYVASTLTLLAMQGERFSVKVATERTPAVSAASDVGADVSQLTFWQFWRTSRFLQVILLIVVVSTFVDGGLEGVALPALAMGPLHAGATGYGLLLAAYAAGALLGGFGAGLIKPFPRRGLLALLLLLGDACGMAMLPYAGGVAGAAIALAVWGLANGMRDVIYYTILQQRFPRHLLGRLMGVIMFATLSVNPLSVALAGVLIAQIGPVVVFPASGAIMVVSVIIGVFQPEVRRDE